MIFLYALIPKGGSRLIDGGTATRFMNDLILQIESISLA